MSMENHEARIRELEQRLAADAKANGGLVSRLLSPFRFLLGTLLVASLSAAKVDVVLHIPV